MQTKFRNLLEVVPPLRPGDQHLSGFPGALTPANQAELLIGQSLEVLDPIDADARMTTPIRVPLEETFYLRVPARPAFLNVIRVRLIADARRMFDQLDWVWLPAALTVDIEPTARAVYMGTLRFHRDAFFNIRRVEIVDSYSQEQTAFQQRFGQGEPLLRRLARATVSRVHRNPVKPEIVNFAARGDATQ